MSKTLFALVVAAAGLAGFPALSQAQNTSGWFINGSVGQSSLDKGIYDDDDTGFAANFGYRWAVDPAVLIGVEGGYADLGSFAPRSGYVGLPIGKAEVKGWNLGVNGHFNVSDNWYLSGRAGYFRPDVRGYRVNAANEATRVDDNASKWYAGIGFGYDFNSNVSVGLNYDYYKADVKGLDFDPHLVSISAEYRF